MDDETLSAKMMEIAKCVKGLTLSLNEVDGADSIVKIATNVQELVESFRLLGTYYVNEVLKIYRQLETKSREVEDLSRQLQQVHRGINNGGPSTGPKPDFHFDDHRQQQRREKETGTDGGKFVSELSKGEGDSFEYNRTNRSNFQISKPKSREEGLREDSTFGKGVPYGNHKEIEGKKEQTENRAAENRSFSPALPKDDKHLQDSSRLEPNQKGYFHLGSSKQSSLYSESDHDISLVDCDSIDQGTAAYTQRTPSTQASSLCKESFVAVVNSTGVVSRSTP